MKQGPYWVEQTEHGLRFTLRRGTWQFKRLQAEQTKLKRKQDDLHDAAANIALPMLAAFIAYAIARLFM